jgi:hypothetical protein
LVLDRLAGSNITGRVAGDLNPDAGPENDLDDLRTSALRFGIELPSWG